MEWNDELDILTLWWLPPYNDHPHNKTTFNKDHTTLIPKLHMIGPISMPQVTFKKDHLFIKMIHIEP